MLNRVGHRSFILSSRLVSLSFQHYLVSLKINLEPFFHHFARVHQEGEESISFLFQASYKLALNLISLLVSLSNSCKLLIRGSKISFFFHSLKLETSRIKAPCSSKPFSCSFINVRGVSLILEP